ncbi:MAG: proton-conducting transporter transmembrane domain-containing protein [Anaerolineae bacterium]
MLELLVIGTFCYGCVLGLLPARALRIRWAQYGAWITAILSLSLLLTGSASFRINLDWVPEQGFSGLDLSPPITYLVLGAFGSLPLIFAWKKDNDSSESTYWPSLVFISCSLLVIALTLEHFLTRYAILELVVLLAMAAFMLTPHAKNREFPLKYYMYFRIGDTGLILAILLAYRCAGTFQIQEMLSCVFSGGLEPGSMVLLLVGATLSAWVKLGLPPFHGWLLGTARFSWAGHTWFAGICLPLLGAYLLKRFSPGWASLGLWHGLLPSAGVVIFFWLVVRWRKLAHKGTILLIGHGALALLIAGTRWMDLYLITFIPARWLLCWGSAAWWPNAARHSGQLALVGSRTAPLRFVLAIAGWLDNALEQGMFDRVGHSVATVIRQAGQALQRGHSGRLGRYLLWAVMGGCVIVILALVMPV